MKKYLESFNKYWVAPTIAIVGTLLGLYFSTIKQNLENQSIKISNTAESIESELKQKEFNNSLKLQMYNEVKDAILKKDTSLQKAVMLIVNEMLADDSIFRDKLLTLLLASPNTVNSLRTEQRKNDTITRYFRMEESQISASKFTIDIFYLDDIKTEAKPRAEKIKSILSAKYPDYNVRVRLLPRNINARNGYRISGNEIRYEENEKDIANQALKLIEQNKIFSAEQPKLQLSHQNSPKYISIFVRNM